MRALPDHRGGAVRGLASRLGGIAPAAGASIVRSRLFIKYVALFVAVVSLALVANGAFDVYFSYQEQKASLVRVQREQAGAAAGKIGQFIGEIEGQVGWTTQLPWSAGTLEPRRFDARPAKKRRRDILDGRRCRDSDNRRRYRERRDARLWNCDEEIIPGDDAADNGACSLRDIEPERHETPLH